MPDSDYLKEALQAFLECALWSSTDEDGDPYDDTYNVHDFAYPAVEDAQLDVEGMIDDAEKEGLLEGIPASQFGHDFWLTRNGHGAGFWDRGLGKQGDRLTEMSKIYGSCYIYVGDDGKVYIG
jgi:hypothetical protein